MPSASVTFAGAWDWLLPVLVAVDPEALGSAENATGTQSASAAPRTVTNTIRLIGVRIMGCPPCLDVLNVLDPHCGSQCAADPRICTDRGTSDVRRRWEFPR